MNDRGALSGEDAMRADQAAARVLQRLDDDNLYMRDAMRTLWRGRAIILVVLGTCILCGIIWLKLQTPLYAATMAIAPVQTQNQVGGERASGLSSMLTGLNLGGEQDVSPFQEYQQLLVSAASAHVLDQKFHLLRREYSSRWDQAHNRWQPPSGMRSYLAAIVKRFFGRPAWVPPDDNALLDILQARVSISAVGDTPMRQVRVLDRDPAYASWLLKTLSSEVDGIIRRNAQQRTAAQIAYLDAKLPQISNVAHLEAISRLLSDQEQSLMLTQIDQPYALRIIGTVTISDAPVSPQIPLVLSLSIVVGLVLGILVVFLLGAFGRGTQRLGIHLISHHVGRFRQALGASISAI